MPSVKSVFSMFDVKTWGLMALGGTTVVMGAVLVAQWKHASIGRQVSNNVVRFLTDHGAHVSNGVISGGVVSEPMKVNVAVNSTVVQMLNAVAEQLNAQRKAPAPAQESSAPSFADVTRRSRRDRAIKQTKRVTRATSSAPPSPRTPGMVTQGLVDDGGYADQSRKPSDYNPNEFAPAAKPKGGKVFSDDEDAGGGGADVVGPVGDCSDEEGDFQ